MGLRPDLIANYTRQANLHLHHNANEGIIPRSLAGRGNVDLVFSVDGKAANAATLNIK